MDSRSGRRAKRNLGHEGLDKGGRFGKGFFFGDLRKEGMQSSLRRRRSVGRSVDLLRMKGTHRRGTHLIGIAQKDRRRCLDNPAMNSKGGCCGVRGTSALATAARASPAAKMKQMDFVCSW